MSYLSMMEARLPPGFRFHPRDEELVCDYLAKKLTGELYNCPILMEVDLNKCEPWDLPELACVGGKEWYFFSFRDRKYATGQRTNRATTSGYWKATGKDRPVLGKGVLVGMKKTLVFYQGRAPKGRKTDWVMHEFRMEGQDAAVADMPRLSSKEDWVLCRVCYKNKGVCIQPSRVACCDGSAVSVPNPSFMENYITFDQNEVRMEGYEQVPCFSNHPSHISPTERSLATKPPVNFGDLTHDMDYCMNPLSCTEDVIKAFLSHSTKWEGNRKDHLNVAEGSVGCYISPPMWNSFGT